MKALKTIALALYMALCIANWGYLVLGISGILIFLLLNNKTK